MHSHARLYRLTNTWQIKHAGILQQQLLRDQLLTQYLLPLLLLLPLTDS